ncbi:MAG: SH3 domain-containing protein [Chloroflexota bacterium]
MMKLSRSIAIGLFFLLLASSVAAQEAVTGTVYQTTNVRGGPDTRFEIVGQLSAGDEVIIDGRDAQSRWLHVLLPGGEGGWLPVFALILTGDVNDVAVFVDEQATPSPQSNVSVISYGRVNVRGGPGIDFGIVGQLDVDQQAEAIARSTPQNDWLMIRFGEADSESNGWVAYFTVRVQGDTDLLPVLVPDNSGASLIPPSRLLRARFNVRLHDQPVLASDVTATVEFDSEVTAIGRTPSGDWLFVGFGEQTGWGLAQLFEISREEIQSLPIFDGKQPESTPEATAAS